MKNLLLIDSAVPDYQTFVDSVNSDTIPFVYRSSTSRQDLLDLIGEDTIDRIGIVFSHTPHFLEGLFFSDTNTDFFIDLIRRCEIKNLDFLACDTLRNPIWKTFYDKLHNETGVVVGASDNATGNIKYGGDWILESTSEDIENVYFTNKIEYYKYLLGADISMIVKTDGKIWASGYNGGLNLANGDMTYANKSSFIDITSLQSTEFQSKTVKLFKIGKLQGNFTFVLMTDGTLWGAGDSNRVGANTVNNMFAKVPSFGTIVSFDCGSEYTVVHTTNNKLWGVGSNYYGQLGMPKSVNQITTFTELSGITGTIKAFACGSYHTIVLTTSNKLWVTGFNGYGNLGTGDSVDKTSFTLVNLDTVSGKIPELIDCGVMSSYVSMTDGTIWQASYSGVFEQFSNGYNYYNGSRKPIKFALAYYHSAVLMSDGTVWGLGDPSLLGPDINTHHNNEFSPLTLPTTVRSIFLGMNYTIMLGTNNTLYATGMNDYGQFGNGSAPNSQAIKTYVTSTTNVFLLAGDTVIVDVLSITSISQASNGLVTINGTKFTTPTVTMTGFTSGTVTKVSATQLTFTPSSFIGSSTFTVTDSGTSVSLTASFPSITRITQAASGLVTINGTNFVTPTVTMTGGFTSGTVTRVSATQLTFTSSSYIGSSTFTVTDSDSSVSFTASFPTITSINQSANGFVTINGTNFVTPTVTMTGGFTSGTVTRVSASQLTFTSSSYIGSSAFTVTDSGNSVSLTVSFPSITSITQAANGMVTINGSNFTTSTVSMTGGFTSGTVTRVSANQLTFTPSSFIVSSTFTVADSGNSVAYTASFPSISIITQSPNGLVSINGSNFTTSSVTMTSGFTSGTVTRVSSSQLTFTPSPTMLTPPITFTLSDSGSSATYIYSSNVPLPIITSFTPSSGPRNTVVTITGSNFGNVTSVLFGSVTATNPTITETTITVNAPINNKSVPITLISSGFSVISSTNFTYNTNPTLFTSSTNDAYDKLLTQLSLTDGIADTGVLNIGSTTTPINFSGPLYGTTVSSSDNSSALATTAFVKAQGYSTGGGSSVEYAQMAVAQTWSAIQTFSSGVQSSVYNALTATSNVSVGSNLTTGILNLGTSTSTVNLNVPLTPTYTSASLSGQVGYTVVLPPLDTVTYQFSGGDLVYRYVPIVQGTYVVTGAVTTTITLDYFNIHFSALKVTPAAGLDTTNFAIPADRILAFAGLKASALSTNAVLAGTTWSITSTMYIPAGYTSLALVTNTYKGPSGSSPFSKINTTMSVTRIA